MYNCDVCKTSVPHGTKVLKHQILRTEDEQRIDPDNGFYRTIRAGSILKELKVCPTCFQGLLSGMPISLLETRRPTVPPPEITPTPLPPLRAAVIRRAVRKGIQT